MHKRGSGPNKRGGKGKKGSFGSERGAKKGFRTGGKRPERSATSRKRIDFPSSRVIIGRNVLREVIKHAPNRLLKVYTTESGGRDTGSRKELLDDLNKLNIPIEFHDQDSLTLSVDSDSHQSFVAALKEKHSESLKDFIDKSIEKKTSLVLALDSINDPQNLGAIFRAADCFAADAILFSKNRGTAVTPAVTKASVGASELVNLIYISNLVDALEKLKQGGYWIIAADVNKNSQSINDFKFPEKSVLLMGSEGPGLQDLLKKIADFSLEIPLLGKINSLNVSQASSIFLHSYRRQFAE